MPITFSLECGGFEGLNDRRIIRVYDDEFNETWMDSDDDETAVVRCSNCGEDVYAEADSCPHCGEYLIANSSPLSGKPTWYLGLALLGIAAVILALSGVMAFF